MFPVSRGSSELDSRSLWLRNQLAAGTDLQGPIQEIEGQAAEGIGSEDPDETGAVSGERAAGTSKASTAALTHGIAVALACHVNGGIDDGGQHMSCEVML